MILLFKKGVNILKNKYLENNLDNPKYLFSGSPYLLEYLEPRKANDENHNPLNEDFAIYLSSSLIIASAYSFGKNPNYVGDFETDRINGNPYVYFENDCLSDEEIGYIYVFEYDKEKFVHNGGRSLQYRCHQKIKPKEIFIIKFKEYKNLYDIRNQKIKKV